MARSEQTIYDAIVADLQSGDYPQLQAVFTSISNTAIFSLLFWIVAKAINIFEQIMDTFQSDLATTEQETVYGHVKWIAAKVLEFQYGDDILFDGSQAPYYAMVDPTKCVVALTAVVPLGDGTVLIKASQAAGVPLTSDMLSGLTSFLSQILPAGTVFSCTSLNPDQVRIIGSYYYDPQNAPADVLTSIQTAINNYLATLSTIDYNGELYASQINVLMSTCLGYIDWVPTEIDILEVGVWTAIGRNYVAQSGSFIIGAAPNDLATTITLVPQIP